MCFSVVVSFLCFITVHQFHVRETWYSWFYLAAGSADAAGTVLDDVGALFLATFAAAAIPNATPTPTPTKPTVLSSFPNCIVPPRNAPNRSPVVTPAALTTDF